ncbi:MAG: O-antigen ligase family protein [Anaerolineaceae bacterium]|nr:O-antigen ligase family protein [Anaerolineaceae bacterium]
MQRIKLDVILRYIQWGLWAALFFLLPITSIPLVTRLIGGTMVAPPSMLVLLLLIIVWFVPYLLRRGALPALSTPLLGFFAVAVIACARAVFLPVPPFRDATVVRNIIEGIVTLGIGIVFYLLTAIWAADKKRFTAILRWINWSGILIIIWSFIQAVTWQLNTSWPDWIRAIHELFSTGTLFRARVVGFTFEPSWLAHQLNVLYLPFWLASTVTRKSAHSWNFRGISLENILLVCGAALLFLSKSRLGLLAFLLALAYLVVKFSLNITRWLQNKVDGQWRKILVAAAFYFLILLIGVSILFGTGYWMSKTDFRMRALFDLETLRTKSFIEYAEPLSFSARIIYWQTGWDIFGQYPFLGVGLGNAGFYFTEKLDSFGWGLIEIRDYMYRFPSIPNIKSMWVRILAETGIVGFAFWIVWIFLMLQTARLLYRQKNALLRTCGLAGTLALIAFLLEGFSIDSFAMPYIWITLGLINAGHVMRRESEE